jgi:hypothetical protein
VPARRVAPRPPRRRSLRSRSRGLDVTCRRGHGSKTFVKPSTCLPPAITAQPETVPADRRGFAPRCWLHLNAGRIPALVADPVPIAYPSIWSSYRAPRSPASRLRPTRCRLRGLGRDVRRRSPSWDWRRLPGRRRATGRNGSPVGRCNHDVTPAVADVVCARKETMLLRTSTGTCSRL